MKKTKCKHICNMYELNYDFLTEQIYTKCSKCNESITLKLNEAPKHIKEYLINTLSKDWDKLYTNTGHA